jgi:hypothetical protein
MTSIPQPTQILVSCQQTRFNIVEDNASKEVSSYEELPVPLVDIKASLLD